MVRTINRRELSERLAWHLDREAIGTGDVRTSALNHDLRIGLDPLAEAIGFTMRDIERDYGFGLDVPGGVIEFDEQRYFPVSWAKRTIAHLLPFSRNMEPEATERLYS